MLIKFFVLNYVSLNLSFLPLREKCPYSQFFWSVFSRIRTEYGEILVYGVVVTLYYSINTTIITIIVIIIIIITATITIVLDVILLLLI